MKRVTKIPSLHVSPFRRPLLYRYYRKLCNMLFGHTAIIVSMGKCCTRCLCCMSSPENSIGANLVQIGNCLSLSVHFYTILRMLFGLLLPSCANTSPVSAVFFTVSFFFSFRIFSGGHSERRRPEDIRRSAVCVLVTACNLMFLAAIIGDRKLI